MKSPRRYLIYTLSHPETGEVRYVGKTTIGLKNRLKGHRANARRQLKLGQKSYIANWINSLPSSPIIEELEELVDEAALSEAEVFWIENFRWLGFRLVNITAGGVSRPAGSKASEETKRKISLSLLGHKRLLGYKHSDESKKRMTLAKIGNKNNLGKTRSEDQKKAMSNRLLGTRRRFGTSTSEQARRNMSGRKLSIEEKIVKSRANGGKPFVDQFGNRYETIRGAADFLNIDRANLSACLKGRAKSVKGYVFKYIEESKG